MHGRRANRLKRILMFICTRVGIYLVNLSYEAHTNCVVKVILRWIAAQNTLELITFFKTQPRHYEQRQRTEC